MEEPQRLVVVKVTAELKVETYAPGRTKEEAVDYIKNLAEQKSPDLIDGKIKELETEILWVD
ncbi:hypothetical protein [Mammaliicoccus sciuri]|uniref:hypothetical protein n=1 Tax=Mammaliicoccus sciuri TaxID=1296 RepID=UPI0021D3DCA1|nr:hypothetical protein [Mammaliicoccus sciuri]UXV31899.1 hypothetical protein MUA60_13300 [Mammaliicoccus sciuri]